MLSRDFPVLSRGLELTGKDSCPGHVIVSSVWALRSGHNYQQQLTLKLCTYKYQTLRKLTVETSFIHDLIFFIKLTVIVF